MSCLGRKPASEMQCKLLRHHQFSCASTTFIYWHWRIVLENRAGVRHRTTIRQTGSREHSLHALCNQIDRPSLVV